MLDKIIRQQTKEIFETMKFTYFNVAQGGVICVAGGHTRDRKEAAFGVSFCSPKDQFQRKIGRLLAIKDLVYRIDSFGIEEVPTNKSPFDYRTEKLYEVIRSGDCPQWLLKNLEKEYVIKFRTITKKQKKELRNNNQDNY